ncbi:hypothetical protein B9Z19DRAFT_1079987, partial [Tuber borchii]
MGVRWICCREMGQVVDESDSYVARIGPASHQLDKKFVNPATPVANKVVCSSAGMQAMISLN